MKLTAGVISFNLHKAELPWIGQIKLGRRAFTFDVTNKKQQHGGGRLMGLSARNDDKKSNRTAAHSSKLSYRLARKLKMLRDDLLTSYENCEFF